MANAAWLALAVVAHNLGRADGQLAGPDPERATATTLRCTVFTVPGRLLHSGRRGHLRLTARWPWAEATRALRPDPRPPAALLNTCPTTTNRTLEKTGDRQFHTL